MLRLPPHNIAHATFMRPFQCDLQPQRQETHRTTHMNKDSCKTHRRNQSRPERPQPHPPHRRGTFHRRLQPLYTEKHEVLCSGYLPTSLRHHFPSSPLPFFTTSLPHHFPSSPLPFFTTSLPHHFPSSPLPFFTTPLHHHFPSSPLPFFTTSLPHHFPSSPLPFIITSLLHHSPSSSLPFFTTPLHHHFPSSPLPFFTTSLLHHFPSILPFIITSLRRHLPFVMYCYVMQSLTPPFIKVNFFCYVLLCNVMSRTTLHQGQFFSDVLLCHVKSHTTLHQGQSLNRAPPFIISSLRILFVRNTEVLLPNFL